MLHEKHHLDLFNAAYRYFEYRVIPQGVEVPEIVGSVPQVCETMYSDEAMVVHNIHRCMGHYVDAQRNVSRNLASSSPGRFQTDGVIVRARHSFCGILWHQLLFYTMRQFPGTLVLLMCRDGAVLCKNEMVERVYPPENASMDSLRVCKELLDAVSECMRTTFSTSIGSPVLMMLDTRDCDASFLLFATKHLRTLHPLVMLVVADISGPVDCRKNVSLLREFAPRETFVTLPPLAYSEIQLLATLADWADQ